MKCILPALALLFVSGAANAKDYTVSFDHTVYHLAYAKERHAYAINEYIPAGSTLDNWKKMVAVNIYHMHGMTPEQFALGLGEKAKKDTPGANYQLVVNKKTDEAVLDFLIWTTQSPVIAEFDIFKFKKASDSDDLIAYQYAFRNYGHLTQAYADDFKNNRIRLRNLMIKSPYPQFIAEQDFHP